MTVTNAVETTMIWGTVSGASMVGMVISLLLSVGLPIFLCIFIYKKTKAWVPAFFIGCGIFVGFAMILEQICHAIVLTVTGSVIRDNIWLYAIYGGLAAALFEECGRWIAMTFCLKKHLTRENALMYGAGHGGIEAFLILGMSSMSNLLTAAMINGGLMEKTMTALEPAQQEVTYHQLSVLWTTPAYQFYLAPVERISAIALQIALSILVYSAVKTGRKLQLAAAFGLHFAVDFLKSTTKALLNGGLTDKNHISAKGKNVMVIGGGDTGNDCVGTSVRHGAKSVLQLEMMPKLPDTRTENNPWPQWPMVCKTDYGQEEAIGVFGHDPRVYQTTVKEFLKDKKGNLKGAVLVKLSPEKDPKSGRTIMKPVEGSEYKVETELVLIAAGFLGSESYLTKAFGVEVDGRTNIATADGTHQTNVKNVFAAGDVRRGQSLVVWAIREGRDVAREVDKSLMEYTNL